MKVKELRQYCIGCPSAWSGTVELNGEKYPLYIRYRWGTISVWRGTKEIHRKKIGGDDDDVLSPEIMIFELHHILNFQEVIEDVVTQLEYHESVYCKSSNKEN